ncbi:hypothetical protein SDC9_156466 [bioreactor metagenome]|uniref:Glycosyltransferase RgtA/B/C/D-like domain-containing protein n=1 Tax=bioreactor metagenome TaxID=1076179 RepID=A0A645F498_9ZZZZ
MFAVYLTLYGAWADYIRQAWIFPASFAGERGERGNLAILFGCLFPFRSVFLLFPLATLGLLGWVGLRLFRRRDDREALLLAAVLIAGLASWHQYFPVPCIRHFYWAGIPMFGAFLLVLQLLWRSRWRKAVRIPLFVLLLAWPAWAAGERAAGAAERIASIPQRRCSSLPGVRGILMEGELEAAYFSAVERAIRRIPREYAGRMFLNLTPHALFCCFFADRPGFRPMYVNWKNGVYPDYAEKASEAVREFRPLIMSVAPEPFRGYCPVGGFPESEPYYYLSIPPE